MRLACKTHAHTWSRKGLLSRDPSTDRSEIVKRFGTPEAYKKAPMMEMGGMDMPGGKMKMDQDTPMKHKGMDMKH